MNDTELDLSYDFICLCCGGRNGEDHPLCSIHNYPLYAEDSSKLEGFFAESPYNFNEWFKSNDYLGSVIIPADYTVSVEHLKLLQSLASVVPKTVKGPRLYQSIMCDEIIPNVTRLPAYNTRQFDN